LLRHRRGDSTFSIPHLPMMEPVVREAVDADSFALHVATEIRQPYEAVLKESGSVSRAQDAVYARTRWILREFLEIDGIRAAVAGI
jgi:hypothetical protein